MKRPLDALIRTYQYLEAHKQNTLIGAAIRKNWATDILHHLNVSVNEVGTVATSSPAIFVANHVSYLDIPLLMSVLPDCVFVSKAEIAMWPLFGTAAKKIGTVFLQRSSSNSRSAARLEIERQLLEEQKRIVIFPAGTTSVSGEPFWRKGVFEISLQHQIPIQPIRINYLPLRRVGYVGRDFFPTHLLRLTKGGPIEAQVTLHDPLVVRKLARDLEYCRNWCSSGVYESSYFDCGFQVGGA
jgi:1-acyl-sn-glycerol-3-phosphate acyltransferase